MEQPRPFSNTEKAEADVIDAEIAQLEKDKEAILAMRTNDNSAQAEDAKRLEEIESRIAALQEKKDRARRGVPNQ